MRPTQLWTTPACIWKPAFWHMLYQHVGRPGVTGVPGFGFPIRSPDSICFAAAPGSHPGYVVANDSSDFSTLPCRLRAACTPQISSSVLTGIHHGHEPSLA